MWFHLIGPKELIQKPERSIFEVDGADSQAGLRESHTEIPDSPFQTKGGALNRSLVHFSSFPFIRL